MPTFDSNELLECLKTLCVLDKDWIRCTTEPDQFYNRIVHFSTDKTLGVRTPQNTKLLAYVNPILLSHKPISLKCSTNVYKNWPLGHGSHRISGNTGPLMPTIADAKNNGFSDVLWLLDDYIKEMSILNVFVLIQSRYGHLELITPPNDGCIVNGVTRKSIVEMGQMIFDKWGVKVVEREMSIHEMIAAGREDRLLEMFGAATHRSIMPIERVVYRDTIMKLNTETGGSFGKELK